ncbi:polysaccharide pyruvyl transferase family protein [Isoalcanivorax indicus]|uniref:polysaccharide pyruvyl transferase family protein n=1 Tax=Isoalcanivorax indicus TaxID=2202653 RepID=UPI000DB91191|nr:polysaccharide pyruvyl transferase family protein [Isoalcanivorax indicus]
MNISLQDGAEALQSHQTIMAKLSAPDPALDRLIKGHRLVLMDIPVYGNIGDLLIMLGTCSYLRRFAQPPSLTVSAYNPCFDAIRPDDVILMQGGGNLGDIYPIHQTLREEVVRKFPGNRIIILPQSIHFLHQENLDRCMSLFASHNDLHLFVRDKASYKLAEPLQDRRSMAPDMAHYLYPIGTRSEPSKDQLFLLRKDIESTCEAPLHPAHMTVDWYDILGSRHRRIIRFFRSLFKRARTPGTANAVAALWLRYSSHIAKLAERRFSRYGSVRTDRLHAHILACLMDKPHEVLDNSYGKNSRYIDAWTAESPLVTLSTPRETEQ